MLKKRVTEKWKIRKNKNMEFLKEATRTLEMLFQKEVLGNFVQSILFAGGPGTFLFFIFLFFPKKNYTKIKKNHTAYQSNVGRQSHGHLGTRIPLSMQDEELIISNKILTESRVQNFRKMKHRRVRFTLSFPYETKYAMLKKIQNMMQRIIEKKDLATFDRCVFFEFGATALIFEIVYFVNSKEYTDFIHLHHVINMEIKERLEKESLEIAFPTQTVHVKNKSLF